jgi:hypothetical protein
MSKPLTFAELGVGKAFIFFPRDGDDSGHGGYRKPYRVFWKLSDVTEPNAVDAVDGTPSNMTPGMEVLRVIVCRTDR